MLHRDRSKASLITEAAGLHFRTWKMGSACRKTGRNETPQEAAVRELFEETGIVLESPSQIQRLHSLYMRKPEVEYVYHLFKVNLDQIPMVCISKEHQSYTWATLGDLESLPLMDGAEGALQCYRSNVNKKRSAAVVSAYLILREDGKVLLQLRKNTGYCDGMWSLIAGHVEEGNLQQLRWFEKLMKKLDLNSTFLK